MQIELGMMGAVTIMGMAVQARVLMALQARLKEINAEQERKNAEVEAKAASRFAQRDEELAQWEQEHGRGTGSRYSSRPDDLEASRTLTPDTRRASSQFSIFKGGRDKRQSTMTMADLSAAPQSIPKEESVATPQLTLEFGESALLTTPVGQPEVEDASAKKDSDLLKEIRGIHEAIASIKQERATPLPTFTTQEVKTNDGKSRPRGGSLGNAFSSNTVGVGLRQQADSSTKRGNSTPLLSEWDEYVKNRSLFQPPSGVSQPVVPTNVQPRPHSIAMPLAVVQAAEQRQRQEKAFEESGREAYLSGRTSSYGSRPASALFGSFQNTATGLGEPLPSADRRRTHSDSRSLTQLQPRPTSQLVILPPRPSPVQAPEQPVVKTFEQLSARHKEKMRALQDPLSKKAQEEAEVAAARSRWERSLATEKNVMNRKEQESTRRDRPERNGDGRQSHTRSSSAFGLQASVDPSGRPTSTAKVHDWQRYQDAARSSQANVRAPGRSRSKSPLPLSGGRQTESIRQPSGRKGPST